MLKPIVGRKGQKVTVYADPITQKKVEGTGILIEFVSKVDDIEYWKLRFIGDDGIFTRGVELPEVK